MTLKKALCRDWKLYLVTDPRTARGRLLEQVVEEAILGGVSVVQLRDKTASDEELVILAKRLLQVTRRAGIPLIINDRIGVCRSVMAEGLHLGQEDASLDEARRVLGESVLMGRSTHSPDQALAAEREGFDYIGVGPVFKTPTKPTYEPAGLDFVRFASENIQIPFVAIGGIDAANASLVRGAGASAVAVVRAIMSAEDPRAAAQKINEVMR